MKKLLISLLFLPLASMATGEIAFSAKQMQTLGIRVAKLSPAGANASNRLPGEIIVPVGQERMVSAPQSGLVSAMHVAVGQQVRRGQVLAQLSSADLVALQRDYLQGKTQQKLARNMLERDQDLYREGVIAERRLLSTQSSHEELAVNLEQRRQALRLAGMGEGTIKRLESHGELASGLTLTAPMDGVVMEQMAATGQRLEMSAPIYRIARLNPLWLEIHAPVEVLEYVKAGMGVTIPQFQASGKIITIIRNINREDQTVHMRAEIINGAEKLSPGQFVEAEIITGTISHQYAVPKSAVVRNAGKTWVFVQTARGFLPQAVTLVSEQSEHAMISGAFSGNEKVAISGTVAIKAAWMGASGE